FINDSKPAMICSSEETSTWPVPTRAPKDSNSFFAAAFLSALRPQITTLPPCLAIPRAKPSPMPLLPPVTRATLPLRSKSPFAMGIPLRNDLRGSFSWWVRPDNAQRCRRPDALMKAGQKTLAPVERPRKCLQPQAQVGLYLRSFDASDAKSVIGAGNDMQLRG